ncbi:hypothetical protein UFOVP116_10 [uncultured Caudovirales phage]|uniref:Uncharacterized protein n=1 Tax=uncultured Caudovirales phage TaxID=2100421 RepID=A0A6J5L614_9CAUD|nr:hypothetical protein UFOVP116_10 [uncultured Caudovirales phage]
MTTNVRILSDVSLNGNLSFEKNHTGFPPNPAPRTLIVKDGIPYLYTELVNGSGYYTWTPIGSRQSAHLHTQGVASSEWTVTHNFNSENFGYFVYDQDHNLVLANTQIIDPNTVKVLLTMATTGTAVFFSMESIFTQMVNASDNVQINTITLRDAAGVLTVNNNPVAMAEAVANSFAQVYTKAQTDSAIINAVAVETQSRIAADDLLSARLDDLQIGTSTLDSLSQVVAAFQAADSDLSNAITNVLGTHTSELAAEIQDRIEADATNLVVAKDYADDAVVVEADARVAGDLTTLNAAKVHTDTSIQTLAAGTVAQATKLSTARSINGIEFDGSADISFSTDQVGEGAYNKYYTDARALNVARSALIVTGAASYDPAVGVLNVTGGVTSVASKTGAVVLSSSDVGLGNVDNTSDVNKPVSNATASAISSAQATAAVDATTKANSAKVEAMAASTPIAHVGSTGAAHGAATASTAGFMSASDKSKLDGVAVGATAYAHPANHPASIIVQDTNNRFVSDAEKASWNSKQPAGTYATGTGSATGVNTGDQTTITGNAGSATVLQTARTINGVAFNGSSNITINAVDITARVASSLLGVANGVATLGSDGKVPAAQLPAFIDDVLEYPTLSSFPASGETGKIYVAMDNNKTYRWSGSAYIYITSGAVDSVAGKTGVVALVRADVGLGNVDNTSDANKPVSTAQATANASVQAAAATDATTKANAAQSAAIAASTPIAHVGATGSAHGVATSSIAGFMSAADKGKLDGIQSGATAYTHPATHPASIITQDASNRFVTDAEKAAWNAKQPAGDYTTSTSFKSVSGQSIVGSGDIVVASVSDSATIGGNAIGYREIPQVIKAASYTVTSAEAGKHILHPSSDATGRTYTIPSNATMPSPFPAFLIGAAITIVNQNGAGPITITSPDTIFYAGIGATGNRTLSANGICTLLKITDSSWIISGVGLS